MARSCLRLASLDTLHHSQVQKGSLEACIGQYHQTMNAAQLTLSRIGLVGTACRSSMTKLVSPGDIGKPGSICNFENLFSPPGKAFAFYGLCQASAPLILSPLTSFIYREASKVIFDGEDDTTQHNDSLDDGDTLFLILLNSHQFDTGVP